MILFIVSSLCRSIRWYPKRLASSLVWISKAIQKLRLSIQVQEEVLTTGFSLLSSKIDNEEMENMRHQAGGERVLQPSPGTMLLLRSWAPSPCGLWQLPVPSFFSNWAHAIACFICPYNYCNCDHSCGNRTCKQSIRHPDWKMTLPLLCSKKHFQLYLAGWAPAVRSP